MPKGLVYPPSEVFTDVLTYLTFVYRQFKASHSLQVWVAPTRRGRAAVAVILASRRICDRGRLRLSLVWELQRHSKRCITTSAAVAKQTHFSSNLRTLAAKWTALVATHRRKPLPQCPTRIISSPSNYLMRAAMEVRLFHASHRPMLWWQLSNSLVLQPSRLE